MSYFITGASSGIGKACALFLAKRKENICLFSRNEELLLKIQKEVEEVGGRAIIFKGDVKNLEDLKNGMEEAKKSFGNLKNLICAAGIGYFSPFTSQEIWQVEEMIKVNTIGVINSVYAFIPHIKEEGGRIGIISSIQGKMGFKNMCVYGASKFALHGFVQGLREELKNYNIKISLICPGTVETPFLDKAGRKELPRQARYLRVLTPEEVAKMTIKAMEKGKREVVIPFMAKIFLKLHDTFPALLEKIYYKL